MLDELSQSITLVVVTYMCASSLESTATDREMQAAATELYHLVSPTQKSHLTSLIKSIKVIRDAFEDEREGKGFNWTRLHSIFHYVEWTELHGTASHSDTANYEVRHIPTSSPVLYLPSGVQNAHIHAVKYPYRASNRCNALVQILRANQRRDCMRSLRVQLELSDTIPTAKVLLHPVYQEARTVLPLRGGPQCCISQAIHF